jgi:hypothetical protein
VRDGGIDGLRDSEEKGKRRTTRGDEEKKREKEWDPRLEGRMEVWRGNLE